MKEWKREGYDGTMLVRYFPTFLTSALKIAAVWSSETSVTSQFIHGATTKKQIQNQTLILFKLPLN
jgi:hypothetical protein